MTEAQKSETQPDEKPKSAFPTEGVPQRHPGHQHRVGTQTPRIHRVCVTCNNMFQVTPERYEAKQCPSCHKGG